MTGSLPFPISRDGIELVQHVEFVQRLARGLVVDAATSEDLAQETWLATLERREAPVGGPFWPRLRVDRSRSGKARA